MEREKSVFPSHAKQHPRGLSRGMPCSTPTLVTVTSGDAPTRGHADENLPAEPCLSPCATAFIMSKEKTAVVLIKPSHSGVGLAT